MGNSNNKRSVEYITISINLPVNVTKVDVLNKIKLIDEINTCFKNKYKFCMCEDCKNGGHASFSLFLNGNKEIINHGNKHVLCIKHYHEFINHKNVDFGFDKLRQIRFCTNGKIIFIEDKNDLFYP